MNHADIDDAFSSARAARKAGLLRDARRGFLRVIAAKPEHAGALNALGIMALGDGDGSGAVPFFVRAIAADPEAAELHLNLARAYRTLGDDPAERTALNGALALDQRHFMALVRMAELHERRGEHDDALVRWSAVVQLLDQIEPRPAGLDVLAEHATRYVAQHRADADRAMDDALAGVLAAVPSSDRRRFDACLDNALGRRTIYHNQPSGLHFPFLPADEFFDRGHFPWLAAVEAETATIRGELEAVMAADDPGLSPYVSMPSGTPPNKWSPLNGSLGWSVLHLWRYGMRDDAACARCPETARIFETLVPIANIPGRTPTLMFSILRPQTRIPPHTGVSNARAVVHLPLIVPEHCGYRVGGDTRQWKEGEAWVFDDTIEHEAWNGSDEIRALLIFDVWNPYITETERHLIRQFFSAADAIGQGGRARIGDD